MCVRERKEQRVDADFFETTRAKAISVMAALVLTGAVEPALPLTAVVAVVLAVLRPIEARACLVAAAAAAAALEVALRTSYVRASSAPGSAAVLPFSAAVLAGCVWSLQQRLETARKQRAAEERRAAALLAELVPASMARRAASLHDVVDRASSVGVAFVSLCGFSHAARVLSPTALLELLHDAFLALEAVRKAFPAVEMIKSVGGSFLFVSGLDPAASSPSPQLCSFLLAVRSIRVTAPHPDGHTMCVRVRCGADVGDVVAGVLLQRRFVFDVFGDAVNTAHRMVCLSEPGCVRVTKHFTHAAGPGCQFRACGHEQVKGKGVMPSYYLLPA